MFFCGIGYLLLNINILGICNLNWVFVKFVFVNTTFPLYFLYKTNDFY